MKRFVTFVFCALSLGSLCAQDPERERFEAAVIRPLGAATIGQSRRTEITPGRFRAHGASLAELVTLAYGVEDYQLHGATGWMQSDLYAVDATAGKAVERAQITSMLRTLLVERFQLRLRSEVRKTPVFALVVDKGGSKLGPLSDDETEPRQWSTDERLTLRVGTTVEDLVRSLNRRIGGISLARPVVDRTGIQGLYRIALTFDNQPSADGRSGRLGIDIHSALITQLGLRLAPSEADIRFLAIDHAEKPRSDD